MSNCNDCKNLNITLDKSEPITCTNHICSKHSVLLRYAVKRFTGYIWPCKECDGKDFIKK